MQQLQKQNTSFKFSTHLFGLLNVYQVYLSHKATIAKIPLYLQEKKIVPWYWTSQNEDAFQNIKKLLISDTVLRYHDERSHKSLPLGMGMEQKNGSLCWFVVHGITQTTNHKPASVFPFYEQLCGL